MSADIDDEEAPIKPCPKTWGTRLARHECWYAEGHKGKCLCLCGRGSHKVRPMGEVR